MKSARRMGFTAFTPSLRRLAASTQVGHGRRRLHQRHERGRRCIYCTDREDALFVAGAGNDILNGGEGSDALHGDAGDDTYIFRRGSRQDTIVETELKIDRTYELIRKMERGIAEAKPRQLKF
jgi:hypothetical protein